MSTIETTQTRILSPSRAIPRFARYRRGAAFISAASLLVYVATDHGIVAAVPRLFAPLLVVYLIAVPLWAVALAVVLYALGSVERPEARSRSLQIARAAALMATLVSLILDIALAAKAGVVAQAPTYLLLYGSVGVALVLSNVIARRAHILRGVLPWLGTVTGVTYLVAGIGYGMVLIPGIGTTAYMEGFSVLQPGMVVYIIWAIWIGVELRRSREAGAAEFATR